MNVSWAPALLHMQSNTINEDKWRYNNKQRQASSLPSFLEHLFTNKLMLSNWTKEKEEDLGKPKISFSPASSFLSFVESDNTVIRRWKGTDIYTKFYIKDQGFHRLPWRWSMDFRLKVPDSIWVYHFIHFMSVCISTFPLKTQSVILDTLQ